MYAYVIGDIHGMLYKLEKLLDKIPLDTERDMLVFLGDYVDRGPDSKGVIDVITGLIDGGIRTICLRGNHELMWQNFLNNKDPMTFLVNGGETTLRSYRRGLPEEEPGIPDRHTTFLEGLLPYYEMDGFILVHAGLRPGIPLVEQSEEDLYWIRREFLESQYDFGKRIVFGHTPFHHPFVDKWRIGIDTGAVYGNQLTCVRLPDIEFYSVQ